MDLKEIGRNDIDWTELSVHWSLLIVNCSVNCNNGTYLMYHNAIARKVKVPALLDKLDFFNIIARCSRQHTEQNKTEACLFMCMSRFDIHLYHSGIKYPSFILYSTKEMAIICGNSTKFRHC